MKKVYMMTREGKVVRVKREGRLIMLRTMPFSVWSPSDGDTPELWRGTATDECSARTLRDKYPRQFCA